MGKSLKILIGLLCSGYTLTAIAKDTQLKTSLDYNSAYIANGQQCGKHTLFLDANMDVGDWNFGASFIRPIAGGEAEFDNELNLYLSHNFTITDQTNLEIGAVYYTTTEDNDHKKNASMFWKKKTFSPYAHLTFEQKWASPFLRIEHDFNAETSYTMVGLERDFALSNQISLISEAALGYAWNITNKVEPKDYTYGQFALKLEYRIKNISSYAGLNLAIASEDYFFHKNGMLEDKKFGISFGISAAF